LRTRKGIPRGNNSAGLTLIELLISVAIIGILILGVHRVVGSTISVYQQTSGRQDLLAQARYAMERMALFVQESDMVAEPASASGTTLLKVSERVLDLYDNATHQYTVGGDGIPDCDNDRDGLINHGDSDPVDYVTFDLDSSDSANIKLRETLPDYSSGQTGTYLAPRVLCEHVTSFQCVRISSRLVEIRLTLTQGTSSVTLDTKIKPRLLN
jgi:prepilin-type N-terminal cleavage/methylation domain-containing protein